MRRTSRFHNLLAVAIPLLLALLRQTNAPDLIVTVRDAAGTPLVGLDVQVRADANGPILAHAVTDAQGEANFSGLIVDQVLVSVSGALPDGTPLVHPGRDSGGIALFLGPPPTRLDLRVDPHGLVQPDPATMIDPLPNGPAIATAAPPTGQPGALALPTTAFALTTPRMGRLADPLSPFPSDTAGTTRDTPVVLSWLGGVAIACVFAGAVLVMAIIHGGRR
jgi:hypothetical protein